MNSLKNKVQLIGRLGANPELRNLEGGRSVARMRIATTDTYRNAAGEKIEDTQWHTVVAWGKTAEIAGRFLSKGSEVMVEGRLTYNEYTAKDGTKRYATEVVVNEMLMMDKKPAAADAAAMNATA